MNEEVMLYKQQAAEEYFGSLLVYIVRVIYQTKKTRFGYRRGSLK